MTPAVEVARDLALEGWRCADAETVACLRRALLLYDASMVAGIRYYWDMFGYGDIFGDGDGDGDGNGDGDGYGLGWGYGDGYGNGDGDGSGDGYWDGFGSGNGNGDRR